MSRWSVQRRKGKKTDAQRWEQASPGVGRPSCAEGQEAENPVCERQAGKSQRGRRGGSERSVRPPEVPSPASGCRTGDHTRSPTSSH